MRFMSVMTFSKGRSQCPIGVHAEVASLACRLTNTLSSSPFWPPLSRGLFVTNAQDMTCSRDSKQTHSFEQVASGNTEPNDGQRYVCLTSFEGSSSESDKPVVLSRCCSSRPCLLRFLPCSSSSSWLAVGVLQKVQYSYKHSPTL